MDLQLVILVVVVVQLVVSSVDLVVDLRQGLPRRRRAEQREDARRAALAAEQLLGAKKGESKARHATELLLAQHPGLKPSTARLLVEAAVAEVKKP